MTPAFIRLTFQDGDPLVIRTGAIDAVLKIEGGALPPESGAQIVAVIGANRRVYSVREGHETIARLLAAVGPEVAS